MRAAARGRRRITEPATCAITRAADPDDPPLAGLADMAWQADRGGVYAHVPRSQSVLALPTVGPVDPYLRVYAFTSPLARDAYVLVPGGSHCERRRRAGRVADG